MNICYSFFTSSLSLKFFSRELEDQSSKYAFNKGVKGAVHFAIDCLDLGPIWTRKIERLYEAILRQSAQERLPTRKAPILPVSMLKLLVKNVFYSKYPHTRVFIFFFYNLFLNFLCFVFSVLKTFSIIF